MPMNTRHPLYATYRRWTERDFTGLLDAAQQAWNVASTKARAVQFVYKGQCYRSTLSTLRMKVYDAQGRGIAYRWHDM